MKLNKLVVIVLLWSKMWKKNMVWEHSQNSILGGRASKKVTGFRDQSDVITLYYSWAKVLNNVIYKSWFLLFISKFSGSMESPKNQVEVLLI